MGKLKISTLMTCLIAGVEEDGTIPTIPVVVIHQILNIERFIPLEPEVVKRDFKILRFIFVFRYH